jgi:tetratricopeptide (TPR) repeat protein
MSASINPSQIATPEAPWLGLRSFTEDAQDYFFGRRAELEDLYERILDKPLTILFGQSGLGKSSLLQAALIPRLRAGGFLPVLVRFNHETDAASLDEQMIEHLKEALVAADFHEPVAALITTMEEGATQADWDPAAFLWLLFHDPQYGFIPRPGESGASLLRPVFLIDQFEEIFTLGERPARRAVSLAFRDGLASLVENRPPASLRCRLEEDDELVERLVYQARHTRVLLSLREDFLHVLERWHRSMPSLMENRFELRMLSGPQALEAVVRPGQLRPALPPIIPDEVGHAIVRFVAGVEDDVPLAEIDAVPPLLSLVCAELNAQRLSAGEQQITRAQFEGHSDEILQSFYLRSFDLASYGATLDVIPDADIALKGVKRLIEDRLLSPDGYRESIAFDTIARDLSKATTPQTAKRLLDEIVERRLLTLEERGGVRRLELAHDVLTPIVKASRDERQEKEALAKARRDQERAEAEARRALAERNRLRRFAIMAGVCAVLALGAAITSVLFFVEAKRNQGALRTSLETLDRQKKEQSALRERADSVVGFMMGDIARKFREQGQWRLLSEITDRIETYNNATRQRSDDLGSRLLAAKILSERASVIENRGQVSDALKLMREQIDLLKDIPPENIEGRLHLLNTYRLLAFTIAVAGGHEENWRAAAPYLEEGRRLADDLQKRVPDKPETIAAIVRLIVVAARYTTNESKDAESKAKDATASIGGTNPAGAKTVSDLLDLARRKDEEATAEFQKALSMIRNKSALFPANVDLAAALSSAIRNYGKFLQGKGEYSKAIALFEEDIKKEESALQSDPSNQRPRNSISLSLREIAQTYGYETKTLPKAVEYYQKALAVAHEMVVMVPRGSDGWWLEWGLHEQLANSQNDLVNQNGNKIGKDLTDLMNELWSHRQSELTAARKLVDIEPQSMRWQTVLFSSLDDLCWSTDRQLDFLRKTADKAKVNIRAREALSVADELLREHRTKITARTERSNLANAFLAIGRALVAVDERAEARRAFIASMSACEVMPDKKPCYWEETRGRAALEIALLHERAGETAEMLKWLQTAIQFDPSSDAFTKYAEIYRSGTGVPKDLAKAEAYVRKSEARSLKLFVLPMPIGPTEVLPIQFYVGREFADGRTPLDECNLQIDFLRDKGLYLPSDVNEALQLIWNKSKERGVPFADLIAKVQNFKVVRDMSAEKKLSFLEVVRCLLDDCTKDTAPP